MICGETEPWRRVSRYDLATDHVDEHKASIFSFQFEVETFHLLWLPGMRAITADKCLTQVCDWKKP